MLASTDHKFESFQSPAGQKRLHLCAQLSFPKRSCATNILSARDPNHDADHLGHCLMALFAIPAHTNFPALHFYKQLHNSEDPSSPHVVLEHPPWVHSDRPLGQYASKLCIFRRGLRAARLDLFWLARSQNIALSVCLCRPRRQQPAIVSPCCDPSLLSALPPSQSHMLQPCQHRLTSLWSPVSNACALISLSMPVWQSLLFVKAPSSASTQQSQPLGCASSQLHPLAAWSWYVGSPTPSYADVVLSACSPSHCLSGPCPSHFPHLPPEHMTLFILKFVAHQNFQSPT